MKRKENIITAAFREIKASQTDKISEKLNFEIGKWQT